MKYDNIFLSHDNASNVKSLTTAQKLAEPNKTHAIHAVNLAMQELFAPSLCNVQIAKNRTNHLIDNARFTKLKKKFWPPKPLTEFLTSKQRKK